jgi:hypothetical protein
MQPQQPAEPVKVPENAEVGGSNGVLPIVGGYQDYYELRILPLGNFVVPAGLRLRQISSLSIVACVSRGL